MKYLSLVFLFLLGACDNWNKRLLPGLVSPEQHQADSTRKATRMLLSYWANPSFTTPDFGEQLTGTPVELELFDLRKEYLYFSLPDTPDKDSMIAKICSIPDSVHFGKRDEYGRQKLDQLVLNKRNRLFFRFPVAQFQRKAQIDFKVKRGTITYTITDKEMMAYISNASIYGGLLHFITGYERGNMLTSSNHGAFVGLKGEPSLVRLSQEITKDKASSEEKVQALLDFVSNEIAYNYKEMRSGREVLKRPNEVLFSGDSDCSGKTILFASLLEQIDVDYRLAYLDSHITVLVKGDFPTKNGLSYPLDGSNWFLAESTVEGFKIGQTRLRNPFRADDIQFIQRPSEVSLIRKYPDGTDAKFI